MDWTPLVFIPEKQRYDLAYNKFNMGSVITFIVTADRTLCKTILNIGPDTNCVSEFMSLLKVKKNL